MREEIAIIPEDTPDPKSLAPIRRYGRKMPGTYLYNPVDLWEMFKRYALEYMPTRTYTRKDMLKGGPMAGTVVEIPTQLPMTLETFCLFCDMTPSTFRSYTKRPEYQPVTDMIEAAIFSNNYEMASTGQIHAGLMARKHGMAEQSESRQGSGVDMIPIQFSTPRKTLDAISTGALTDVNPSDEL
jgi:hypothetical protein